MSSLPRREVPFLDLRAQYASIGPELEEAVLRVLRGADYILGEEVESLEAEFARYCESEHAVGVDSGLSALELILRACGVGPGDEVITAASTFIATALAISQVGATPVLADVDSQTGNLDVAAARAAITPRTTAIMPVHLYGQPADMDAITALARAHNLLVIEDACQAHGARWNGRRAGSLGMAAAFSFYPGKNLGGCGDGGMVVTGDAALAERVRVLRNYGQRAKYHHVERGHNHRLDALQAAALRVKLRRLDEWNSARRRHAAAYGELLGGAGVILPGEHPSAEPVWHLYVIRSAQRERLRDHLQQRGVSTGIHYPVPIHLQPAYRDLGYAAGTFPVAEACAREVLSLPMYAELTADHLAAVAAAVAEFQPEQAIAAPPLVA